MTDQEQVWQSETVTTVDVVLRNTQPHDGNIVHRHANIRGLQFRDAYIAVSMKNGECFVYPYAILSQIVTLPAVEFDTSDAARTAALERYKTLNCTASIADEDATLHIGKKAKAPNAT